MYQKKHHALLGREWIHGVGAVPSTLHQRLSIWREDGLVENIEADQSYFRAEVNTITKENFDKQLANILPCISLGPTYEVQDDEMFSMQLILKYGFQWHREIVDVEYVVMNHKEDPSVEENVLRTRAFTYKKVTTHAPNNGLVYGVSPVGWDAVELFVMVEPNFLDKITAYVAKNNMNAAKEAECNIPLNFR